MACPDELTLDLWLADALSTDEAAAVATHVETCTTCAAAVNTASALSGELHAAVALDADELAYLSGLRLASKWRSTSAEPMQAWGWIALAGVIGGYAAWWAIMPAIGWAVGAAAQAGFGTVPLAPVVGLMFGVGQALFDVVRHPAFGLTQPALALLALMLLFMPYQVVPQRSMRS